MLSISINTEDSLLWVMTSNLYWLLNTHLCDKHDKLCQWLVAGWWFSLGAHVSYTNKTDSHDVHVCEILGKLILNTHYPNPELSKSLSYLSDNRSGRCGQCVRPIKHLPDLHIFYNFNWITHILAKSIKWFVYSFKWYLGILMWKYTYNTIDLCMK